MGHEAWKTQGHSFLDDSLLKKGSAAFLWQLVEEGFGSLEKHKATAFSWQLGEEGLGSLEKHKATAFLDDSLLRRLGSLMNTRRKLAAVAKRHKLRAKRWPLVQNIRCLYRSYCFTIVMV